MTRLWKVSVDWSRSLAVMAEPFEFAEDLPVDNDTHGWFLVMDKLSAICVDEGLTFIVADGWLEALVLDCPTRHNPPHRSGSDKYFPCGERGGWIGPWTLGRGYGLGLISLPEPTL